MKKITHCNWWGYIKLRINFRRNCQVRGQQYIEKYKAPNRYLYCKAHRAVLTRYGNIWEKQQPVYVSSFCELEKCNVDLLCENCRHNLNGGV